MLLKETEQEEFGKSVEEGVLCCVRARACVCVPVCGRACVHLEQSLAYICLKTNIGNKQEIVSF